MGSQLAGTLRGADHVDEYRLKAAFLFSLAKFVEWPPETFSSPTDPLVTCILGKGEIEDVLRQAINRKVAGRAFTIRHISDAQEAGGCQVLFVNQSVGRRWLSLGRIKNTGILTVGETDDFISEGGAVNFKLSQDTIRIQINVEAAVRAKLEMSSNLLSLSEILKK
jgi:hypothetical protein